MLITKNMKIQEIVAQHPDTVRVFERYGLACCGCLAAEFENVEAGAVVHNVPVEQLIRDLNDCRRKQ